MLNNISWASYWLFVALLTGAYYLILLVLFYRAALNRWTQSLGPNPHQPFVSGGTSGMNGDRSEKQSVLSDKNYPSETFDADQAPETIPEVRSLVDEVQAFFDGLSGTSNTKPVILARVKEIVRKYPSVENTVYKNSVSQLIVFLAQQHCSVHLRADEVMGVWLG